MTVTAIPQTTAGAPASPQEPAKSGTKKMLLIALAFVGVGAAAWFFVLSPAPEETEPVAGAVMALEPIQINLASGHYLKLGVALQLTEETGEVDGSQALDAAISIFSGRALAELVTTDQREELRVELQNVLDERYDGAVMGVYYTEFVTQ